MSDLLDRALERFHRFVRVCPVTGCWMWQGGLSQGGEKHHLKSACVYGSFYVARGTILRAHIFAAWAFGLIPGPRVPPGCHLDHSCEQSECVNPFHLVLRGYLENVEYSNGTRKRRHPTWAERYAMRGVGPGTDAEPVEPRRDRRLDSG